MTTNRTAQRWILALTSVGSFLVVLDMLVVATALTTIHRDLGASVEDLEWTVNAYTLSFAVFLMSAATMGDRYGRRGSYAAGLALFAVASAACALSTNVGALVAARTVQGIGAAVVMPLALSLLNAAFHRSSVAARWACTAASRASPPPSGRSWAERSRRASPGSGSSGSTCPSQ
jgi:MFS family permease